MTALVIRRARLDEAEALSALILRSKRSNGYDDAFMAQCVDELRVTPERIRQELFWVAETPDGRLAGCTSLHLTPETRSGEIRNFFVDPDHKRKGVGSRLWQTVLGAAREAGLTRMHLDADPFAVPFYSAVGFVVTGETPSGSIPGRVLPFMELPAELLTETESPAS